MKLQVLNWLSKVDIGIEYRSANNKLKKGDRIPGTAHEIIVVVGGEGRTLYEDDVLQIPIDFETEILGELLETDTDLADNLDVILMDAHINEMQRIRNEVCYYLPTQAKQIDSLISRMEDHRNKKAKYL